MQQYSQKPKPIPPLMIGDGKEPKRFTWFTVFTGEIKAFYIKWIFGGKKWLRNQHPNAKLFDKLDNYGLSTSQGLVI